MPVFWRAFIASASAFGLGALLLLFSPIEIDAPIRRGQALVVILGLVVGLVANALLLRRALRPLRRLAQRMEAVDLLRPGQRLQVLRNDEIGRAIIAFNRMVDRLETERQQTSRRVLAGQEAERVGIARHLHDEVGQVLTGVLLHLDSIAESAPSHRGEIDDAKQSVRRALHEVRRISSELRPEMLEQLGLVSALTELTRSFAQTSGVRVDREFARPLPELEAEVELAVYRIVQEGLTNIARHARATRVRMVLESAPQSVVLRVIDDGCGLAEAFEEHGGLRGMRERAVLIGAALAIKPASSGGVEVRVEVPAVGVVSPVQVSP